MRSPPGRCARWPRARSPASRRWRRSWRNVRRYTGTSTPTTSAPPRPICSPTTRRTSRGRRCTSTPGITLWACRGRDGTLGGTSRFPAPSPLVRCADRSSVSLWLTPLRGCSDSSQSQPDLVVLACDLDQPVDVDGDEVPSFRVQLRTGATVDLHLSPQRRGREVESQPATAVDPERCVRLAHVAARPGGLPEPTLA